MAGAMAKVTSSRGPKGRSQSSQTAQGTKTSEKGEGPASQNRAHSTKECIAIVGAAIRRLAISPEEGQAWETVCKAAEGKVSELGTVESQVAGLRGDIKELKKALCNAPTTTGVSWAQVASTQRQQAVPARRERELYLAGSEPTKSIAEVAAGLGGTSTGIQGARKLPSGMIALSFENAELKNKWAQENSQRVREVLGEGAKIREHTVDVIVSGFPAGALSTIPEDQRARAITSRCLGVREVKKVVLMRSNGWRSTETAIVGLASAQEANQVIDKGILWEGACLSAEPYTRGVRPERCYKCQEYAGHTARYCRAQERCAWCAGSGHGIKECPRQKDSSARACAPCKGQRGHAAIDRNCPAKVRADVRAKEVYNTRPTRFQSTTQANQTRPQVNASAQGRPRDQTPGEDGYTMVGQSKKRRALGRPTILSSADTTGMPDIATLFNARHPIVFGSKSTIATEPQLSQDQDHETVLATQEVDMVSSTEPEYHTPVSTAGNDPKGLW